MKFALITGASSGIGWCIAHELAGRGYGIIGVSNQQDRLAQLKASIESQFNLICTTLVLDLATEKSAEKVYEFCSSKNLSPEVLVNNAGVLLTGDFVNYELTKIQKLLHLHMLTLTSMCHLFARQMKEVRRGYILNVSSISAVMPFPVISVYGPSKSYVRAFTKALRVELSEYNVKVSCLIPGATNTPLNDPLNVNIDLAIKLGVMMQPSRVAKKAVVGLLKGKAQIIPGFLNKVIMILTPMIPGFVVRKIYNSSLGKKLKEI